MPQKPANLVFGLDDRPSPGAWLILGLQHVCIISIAFIFPVLVARSIGAGAEVAGNLVSLSMLAGGVGVILQSLRRGPVGSGYLLPQVCGPSFISSSMLAASMGGLPLMFGMTAVAGVTEGLLSRVMHRLRFLFPAEVTGLIVAMVGITVVRLAVANLLGWGDDGEGQGSWEAVTTGLVTLAAMVGVNVWSGGRLRLYSVLVGMVVGYLVSAALGLLGPEQWRDLSQASLLHWPLAHHPGWAFDLRLLMPVVVATLCSTLKTVGDLTTCQKINDEEWKRPDMDNIQKGVLADGLGCLAAGLLGGMGQSSSSSNVGLSMATGATSRVIAWAIGLILIGLAFCPKLAAVFAIMPQPVVGATLVFAVSFMIVAGFSIVMSRMLDGRKTFVVGVALIVGLGVDMVPEAFEGMHPWLAPVFDSSLAAAAVTALVLNLFFRLGIAKKAELNFDPAGDSARQVHGFIDHWGRAWGARKEVMDRVSAALTEIAETLAHMDLAQGPATIQVSFDELKVTAQVTYQGQAMQFPRQAPGPEELLADPAAQAALAGYLVRRYVTRVRGVDQGDGARLDLEFEH